MKTKSPLVLIEQLVMVTVFAFAAVLCLRMFVLSDNISRRTAAVDRAVLEAQTVSEHLKQGSLPGYMNHVCTDGTWQIFYDTDWTPVSSDTFAAYRLTVVYENYGDPLLWTASVSVHTVGGDHLITLPVSGQVWEEVSGDA